jgi:hypothetical protein
LSSPKTHLANGGCSSFSSLSNDISFPPEGYPSLRLPQVVVLHVMSCIISCICFFFLVTQKSPKQGSPAVLLMINFHQFLLSFNLYCQPFRFLYLKHMYIFMHGGTCLCVCWALIHLSFLVLPQIVHVMLILELG